MDNEAVVIYYHPFTGETHTWFSSEESAVRFAAAWLAMERNEKVKAVESMTVVFN